MLASYDIGFDRNPEGGKSLSDEPSWWWNPKEPSWWENKNTETDTIHPNETSNIRTQKCNMFQLRFFWDKITEVVCNQNGPCKKAREIFEAHLSRWLDLTYARFCELMKNINNPT